MKQVLCSVSGIQNQEHRTQIKNSLNKMDGVRSVGIDMSTGTIDVQYNDPATEAYIKDCIEHTGVKIIYG